ncbi:MAG TPA: DUF559 domain-containing protein [Ktedonobacterales bacterium]|nr:DUF559 domain-containing protein [Ktedonobacterales bacterium]
MVAEQVDGNITPMEAIRQINEYGAEFWSARALTRVLDYADWRNFVIAIDRAKLICDVANQDVSVHFSDAYLSAEIGSGAHRDIVDYYLSRYGVHLTLSCADMTKPVVAQSLAYITLTSLPALANPLLVSYARNIKPQDRIAISKEQRAMRQITQAFQHIPFVRNYRVTPYYIDLYFPNQRIAVECDEHDHRRYSEDEDMQRQERIEMALECQFVRFNPDDPTFEVGDVINQIMVLMYESRAGKV